MAKKTDDPGFDLTVSIELEDGSTMECAVLLIYSAGGKEYIAIQPMEQVSDPEGDVYIYGYGVDENGAPELINIEDDEEFDMAIDAFDEHLDEVDFFDTIPEDPNC
ncbi:MAG: DUF1292 domain-containing protein [Lachnospiraceae bacterium]|nr:DUF1292 domain-containing protein [Lachnospiraceae bacterium]